MKRSYPLFAAACTLLLAAGAGALINLFVARSAPRPPHLRTVPASYLHRIGIELRSPTLSPLCELPLLPRSHLSRLTCPVSLEQAEATAGGDTVREAVLGGVRLRSHVTGPTGYPLVWVLVTRPSASGQGPPAATCLPVDGLPTAQPCVGSYPKIELIDAMSGRLLRAYALGM